jgi:hypothetical protein
VGRVKGVSVAGNSCQDLQCIEAISRESKQAYSRIRLPYTLLPELDVVTKG